MEKIKCKKCLVKKPSTLFYKHSGMSNGRLSFCKKCVISRIAKHRILNIEKIRAYDRDRGRRDSKEYDIQYKKKYPGRVKAVTRVNNAVRDGRLSKPEACTICFTKSRVYGHHNDYRKPLDVVWVCQVCHKRLHNE